MAFDCHNLSTKADLTAVIGEQGLDNADRVWMGIAQICGEELHLDPPLYGFCCIAGIGIEAELG